MKALVLITVLLAGCTTAQGASMHDTVKLSGRALDDFCRAQQSTAGQAASTILGGIWDAFTGIIHPIRAEESRP